MDGALELNEVKAELEKFKEECRIKTSLFESLRKVHDEKLTKLQEANLKIENQAQEIHAKSEEISYMRQKYNDLESSFHEKESFLKQLSSTNEKLRLDYAGKIQKFEEENKEFRLALDEEKARSQDLESKISTSYEEIEGLRKLLSVAQKKCLELEQKAHISRELEKREGVTLKLEEENCILQDKLKWRNEQFEHLEEAHQRLQEQFQSSKLEWEREKSMLLKKINLLQTSLDSQTRISEGLQTQLKMCTQALAHNESKRKLLEIEIFEHKSRFENVFLECEEEKSKIENMILEKDDEIAKLRNSLGMKEMLFKEIENQIVHLEQENQQLQGSLKEFQEAQISNAGTTSALKRLQNRLRGLEQLHSKCSVRLKEKEAEWSFQVEKLIGEMNGIASELEAKSEQINEFQMELEGCHCMLEVQNEEISLTILVLKSEFSSAYSKLSKAKTEIELCNKAREEKILLLMEQLEIKENALQKLSIDLEQEHKKVASMMMGVESFDLMKQQQIFVEEELEKHKNLLDESYECQFLLKEQVLQMENSLKEDNKKLSDDLHKAKFELAKKIDEVNQTELELQKWKSFVQNLDMRLEEHRQILKQEKENFLRTIQEKDAKIADLQQKAVLLESVVAAGVEAVETIKQEKESCLREAEHKDSCIEGLHKEIDQLKKESSKREWTLLNARETCEQENERLLKIIKERDQSIKDLSTWSTSLEQDFTSVEISSFTEVTEKQIQIDVLVETINDAKKLEKLKIQEKNRTITELEKKVDDSLQKLVFQGAQLSHLRREVELLEASLKATKCENEELVDQSMNKQRCVEGLVKKLEFEKEAMVESIKKLLSEKEDLLVQFERVCNQISEFSCQDVELMAILGKIMEKCENGPEMDLNASGRLYDYASVVVSTTLSPSTKGLEESVEKRSPLRQLNH